MKTLLYMTVASVALATAATRATAARAAPVASAEPSATPSQTASVAEVIVTAQKRSEKISRVPISITAVSGAQLNETASKTLTELQGVVPGVSFPPPSSYGGAPIVIRGTSGSAVFLEDDPIAVYVDGVYQASNSRFGVADLTDVDSVEIVRGPQGTLQGRNATAGAILVRTVDPGSVLGGYLRASVAEPFEYRAEGAVSIPLADTLGLRLAADDFHQEGFVKNLFNGAHLGGEDAMNARATLLWKPTPRFRARLSLDYATVTNRAAPQRWAYTTVNPTGQAVTAPTPYTPLPAALQSQYLDHDQVDNSIASKTTQRSPNGALQLDYDLGFADLISITGYSSAKNVGQVDSAGLGTTGENGVSLVDSVSGAARNAYNQGRITGHQETEELRLQSRSGERLTWLVGLYGSHSVDNFMFNIFNLKLSSAGNQNIGFTAHQLDESEAVYGDATYRLTDKLSITGGLRYTNEDKKFNNAFSISAVPSGFTFVGPIRYRPAHGNWDDTSYRTNIDYQATPDVLFYASYSKGFKSGGYNAFGVGPNPSYTPETLYSTELGAKAYFLEHRAYIAIAGYDNDYDNLQVTSGVPSGGVIIHNAAVAKIKGFEAEGSYQPVEHYTLSANLAYADAHYTSFANAQGVGGELLDASGNALPNTPKWQYYVQASHDFDLGQDWRGDLQLSWRWRDKVYFFGTNEEPNLQGGVDGELGARLDLTNKPMQLTVSLYGKNLNDTHVVGQEQVSFGYPIAFYNEPRVVGVQVQKKF